MILFRNAVSKRILELCEERNYSQNKLAELSGISNSTLCGIMNNKVANPSSYIIYKICKTLNITLKEFFDSNLFEQNFDD